MPSLKYKKGSTGCGGATQKSLESITSSVRMVRVAERIRRITHSLLPPPAATTVLHATLAVYRHDAGLRGLAAIVHELDLRDELMTSPEAAEIDTVLRGWLLSDMSDAGREAHGIALFDGLYSALASDAASQPGSEESSRDG